MPIRVATLIEFFISQAVKTIKYPTTTPKFMHTPGCINQKIIDLQNQGRRGNI